MEARRSYDAATGRQVRPGTTSGGAARPRWTPLSSSSSMTTGAMVTAYQGGQVDAIVQFDVLSERRCSTDANFTVVDYADATPSPDLDALRHRPVRRRSASARRWRYTIDRPALIAAAVQGQGAARPTITSSGTTIRTSATPSRSARRTSTRPSSCSRTPGKSDLTVDAPVRQAAARSRTSPSLLQSQAAQAGITITPAGERQRPVLRRRSGARAKPADPPCSGAAELGIVDYGHRGHAGRLPQLGASRQGRLELLPVHRRTEFDAAFKEFQSAVGVDAQKAACAKIETILNDDVAGRPCRTVYNYLVRQLEEVHGRLHVRARPDVLLGRPRPSSIRHLGAARNAGRSRSRSSPDGDVADGPLHRAQARCSLSSRCGSSSRSCSSSPTSCPPTSAGRSCRPFAPQESVDALNERLGTNRPSGHATSSPITGRRHARLRGVVRVRASPSAAAPRRRSGARPKLAGLALAHHDPDQHRGRAVRRETEGPQGRPGDRPDRRHVVVHPGVHHRHDPRGRRRRPARLVARPRDPATRTRTSSRRSATC